MSDQIAAQVFRLLRSMDAAAIPRADGKITGLNWYGGHRHPDLTRPQTEPIWSQELAAGLTSAGLPSVSEVSYPASPRRRCDLVVQGRTWIEVKGAWKAYWGKQDHLYRSYLLHPLVPGLDPKTHTAALDVVKLQGLTRKEADTVGLLLIGFERIDNPMDREVAILQDKAGLANWSVSGTAWMDAHRPGERVRCWLWMTEVGDGLDAMEVMRRPHPQQLPDEKEIPDARSSIGDKEQ